MSDWLKKLKQLAQEKPHRVLLPEAEDDRVIAAARMLAEQRLATPVFETEPAEPVPGSIILRQQGDWPVLQRRINDEIDSVFADKGAQAVRAAQGNPLMRAAICLKRDYVDTVVSGSVATTGDVLRAGIRGVGVDNTGLVSSSFILDWQDRVFSFADCAVVPDPDSEQLARIAVAAAHTHEVLTGETPRVALLSMSTRGSAQHPMVDKVTAALEIIHQIAPDLTVDGEMQFDAAFVADVAQRKAPGSAVGGQASVFVFPDLNAGNIGYKIAERMGGATATGPILNGMNKPWLDLSRGCSAADIVNLAVIGSVLAG